MWRPLVAAMVALGVVVGLCSWGYQSNQVSAQEKTDKAPVAKWEYKVIANQPGEEDPEIALNKLGEQGWELVSYTPTGEPRARGGYRAVLKRSKR